MELQLLLYTILAIITINFVLEQWLDYINLKKQSPRLPRELKDIYDEEKYARSIAYQKAQTRFSFLTSTLSYIVFFVMVLSGAFGFLDTWIRVYFSHEIIISLVFFGILYFASDLLSIPFQIYNTFVLEEKFGFNKTTPKTFIADKVKSYFITILLGGGILVLFIWLVLTIGENFWIYFWIISAVLMVLVNILYTSIFVPIFNKLTPLENGELKLAIEDYGKKVDFPIDNIFVIDGSKRSTKANAFFWSWKKKESCLV